MTPMMRRLSPVFALVLWVNGLGCGGPGPAPTVSVSVPVPSRSDSTPSVSQSADESKALPISKVDEPSPFHFSEAHEGSGVDFTHVSGMNGERLFPTANGSGVAIFDGDGDGKLDLYFASGNELPLNRSPRSGNRYYRNLGNWKFEDATERSGLGFRGYCHGITVGDVDNDGDPDVFLANYGGDALFLNRGDGTYQDISSTSGVQRPGDWSSSAAFLDFDHDGDLDLYVSRYGDWSYPADNKFCGDPIRKIRRYCSPKELRYARHTLWRNNGDLTFSDDSEAAGVGRGDGHGFAALAADLDGDGHADLYVANDQDPNFLFLGRPEGTMRDVTLESGAAFNVEGQTQAGMGVDAEDLDGDGRPELFVTNFQEEYNTIYRNLGQGLFLDVTDAFGLAVDSLPWIGWGCILADLDNDSWPDAVVVNAHIDDNASVFGQPRGYSQPPLLHHNQAGKVFRLANRGSGDYFERDHLGHGLAMGDLDDDGDLDLVVNHKDGPPALLRNDSPGTSKHRWIRVVLEGRRSPRDAIGSKVVIKIGSREIVRLVKSGHGLMSSHDPRLLVGLGTADRVDSVIVLWPSGARSEIKQPKLGADLKIIEPSNSERPGP